jgi:1,4-alpha-glucan branching enzyme
LLHPDHVRALTEGRHPSPHADLGVHSVPGGVVYRVVRPLATAVDIIRADGGIVPLEHHLDGLWHGSDSNAATHYTVRASYENAPDWESDDPYRFTPTLGDADLYLWGEGRHEQIWQVLGAHPRTHDGAEGVGFAVWAPRAVAARVVGDFNGWNGATHAMRRIGDNGLWEIFVPGATTGHAYKFEILTAAGHWVTRADPFASSTEIPPLTASRVDQSTFEWSDTEWMEQRAASNPHDQAMSVYEMHLGSWRPGLGYRSIAEPLIGYLQSLGYTHVEFMPLAEHPFGGSWGYQVTGYFAPTSRFGSPDDLRYLINELHRAGIGVIMDWVPAHFPKDEWALARFDGEPLFEHPDPRRGEHPDWGTLVFDFGQPQVRNFLVASGSFWLEEFHIDGLRVDAVASMLYLDYSRNDGEWYPNEHGGRENLDAIRFLQEATATAYRRYPGIVMIAEESTAWPGVTKPTSEGGLGFGMKWNMGWMHDSLSYMERDPMWRSHHHGEITFSFLYAFSENYMLPISHDEVVHGKGSLLTKMPGDQWQKLANVRAYLAFMWAHPGKQLLFMGQEFGQPSEWSEERGLDWWILDQPVHQGLARLVGQLNRVYRDSAALWSLDNSPEGFEWLEGGDSGNNVVAFHRKGAAGESLVAVVNFSGNPVHDYRLGMPAGGDWTEVLNTDATEFGGSGVGNFGQVSTEAVAWGGRDYSAVLQLPPLAAVWFSPTPVSVD